MLVDHSWKRKYTREDGDLVKLFYVPALKNALRYDRLTGYFGAGALALAARGVEGLVRNGGRMRLICGCTLEQPEIEAINKGERLRAQVEHHLEGALVAPPDSAHSDALELLAWMVECKFLEVKVAVPCNFKRKPIPAEGIFHAKSGVIEDPTEHKIAWTGSLNETAAAWERNWERIDVYTSWGPEHLRVNDEERDFENLWQDKSSQVIVLDLPDAARQDLLRFLPKSDRPARLEEQPAERPDSSEEGEEETDKGSSTSRDPDFRSLVWTFIIQAPRWEPRGERIGEATAAVTPWPHQLRAFERLYRPWPPKVLIADEVGLGKTIQAGMLLRQAWLASRARRILILAPKAVLRQWQIELREKFNLHWPIYDGRQLVWHEALEPNARNTCQVDLQDWHREPAVIVSSHLMRRTDRAAELLTAERWDLIVLDEAHHARRRGAASGGDASPNALLRLMNGLKERTAGLVLLTATPLQVHPIELWDLLNLLGMPTEWSQQAFMNFFETIVHPNPSKDAMDFLASLFRASERHYGETALEEVMRLGSVSQYKAAKILRALRDDSSTPRRRLETDERRLATQVIRANTPIRRLVSRHTRTVLRQYLQAGMADTRIADRQVADRFITMSAEEHALYEAVEDYIATTYNQAADRDRNAVGFVMTVYRRRLASSFLALRNTLQRHLDAIALGAANRLVGLDEDASDDELADDVLDADEAGALEREALAAEEKADISVLLDAISRLALDSKLTELKETLANLRQQGYRQVMVFTQYTDTLDFLREELRRDSGLDLICFSGRGGEVPSANGGWRGIDRHDIKRRFRDEQAEILLCTDAAAEGLNFQFCGALINYDMPWNPMRVEQRIGRIDRLGQRHAVIQIVNLHYEGTVETDVYRALRNRIGLFESVVGALQPILATLPRRISASVLKGGEGDSPARANVVGDIERDVEETKARGLDIDQVTESDLLIPHRPEPPFTMEELDRVIRSSDLMPQGAEIQCLGPREYGLRYPGMANQVRVTTSPSFYEQHSESVELWSPGNPLFRGPDSLASVDEDLSAKTLKEVLDG